MKLIQTHQHLFHFKLLGNVVVVLKVNPLKQAGALKQLVLSAPVGDDIEIRSKNLAAVLELLRKMIS